MKRTLFSLLFLLAFISVPNFVSALTVSPARIEIAGDPGQTVTGEILLLEESENGKNYYISFENFEPRGDSGAPYFIGAKDGLATWISADSNVYLNQNEETSVPFSITIPSSAKPGGYFAAVFFGTQPVNGSGGGQVSVGGKVGVLILLRVNGDIEEGGGLLSFNLKGDGRIMTTPPVALEYRFNNTGGDRVVPRGTVTLLNTFRFKTEEVNANPNEGSVLPGSSRKFEIIASDNKILETEEQIAGRNFFDIVKVQLKDFKFGWYTAQLDIEWASTKQSARENYHFFVIPWQSLTVIFSLLFIVVKVFKVVLHRYNKWVLAQAGFSQQVNPQQGQVLNHQVSNKPKVTEPLREVRGLNSLNEKHEKKPLQKPRRRI